MRNLIGKWGGLLLALGLLGVLLFMVLQHPIDQIRIISWGAASVSFVLILSGMVTQCLVWHLSVRATGNITTLRDSFTAYSLTIWAKYVPGKIWSIVGRAGVLARITGVSLKMAVVASTGAQAVMIGAGLIMAAPILVEQWTDIGTGALPFLLVVGAIVSLVVAYLYIGRRIGDSHGRYLYLIPASLCAVSTWIIWGSAFSFLILASGYPQDMLVDTTIFAGATTLGIITFVTPGGLGVREGAISALLVLNGMAWGDAVVLSLAARIWFLIGEVVMSILGLSLARNRRLNAETGY